MDRYLRPAFGVCAAALCAFTTPAHAAGSAVDGLAELKDLNLVVLGDMSAAHDVEGKAFVGGNLSGTSQFGLGRSNQGFTAASTYPTLTVVGSITSGDIKIENGPNGAVSHGVVPAGASIGGSVKDAILLNAANATLLVGGSIGNTNGGTGAVIKTGGSLGNNSSPNGVLVQGNLGAGFSASLISSLAAQSSKLNADMHALSAALAALAPTAGSSFSNADHNNGRITAVDAGQGYAVIDITGGQAQLNSISNLTDSLQVRAGGGYVPTIINVSGSTSYDLNYNSNNSTYNPYIIWNFIGATRINFETQVNGSVLAPDETISNSTPIEGSVVAASFNQGGEVHLGTFAGALPLTSGAPEPGIWAMMMTGVGLMGGALRRRRGAASA